MSVTAKGKRWEILHSLWIGWTFTLGIFNWVAYFYIGIRARQRKWMNVKCGEEGVHVKHAESVPFPSGNGIDKPTLIRGHLPLNIRPNNSHQAFK
jgi:hypothetical protein